ncbi:HTH-type transcriptional regulator MalT [Rubrobacter xylanophilus DSM 9941]|uniref:LuxR C-terminal-related transcriptional regulator n=1 Tax=Rubrobacter xylanophilus TaxID=49319 RepID=UPI001F2D559C|nr:LuxR C-terminal-related transcriptional regulator [Rubrobacter xylanophilus]QYJ15591.1 HTH-type transcriptional regulator MalT [Rubrobacter xylanophilus DSM 9941]
MPQELVTTKLHPPGRRPGLVGRPRLIGRLDPEPDRTLTLLSAPAGFGKSMLLVEWARGLSARGGQVAWLSLDGSDDDPARFLSYLVAAIRRGAGEEGFGEAVLGALRSPQMPPIEALAGALVNEMADLRNELAVILDDYHAIESPTVHAIVSYLLDNLPQRVHLLIASRVDPPLPLARLRARNQMTKLGAAELRFTSEEAAAFLNEVMELGLSAGEVSVLEDRTEGWIAGLQLAALSLRDRRDPCGFVESFSGSHRDVLDFLAEEVLSRQPEEVRRFLLKTSILDSLTGTLCDAVTGGTDGQQMLERLERENLFVVALDDERIWYRYHHLFAGFLRDRLQREHHQQVDELHLRASGWYEESGHLDEAISHALSGRDQDRAASLIGAGSRLAWSRGDVNTVLRWLEELSPEARRRRPWLNLQHAMALALTGRPDDAEDLLDEVERGIEAAGEDREFLSGFASAVRSWCARLRGDAPHAIELARRALALLPGKEGGLRAFAAVVLGDALWTMGDLAPADEALGEAIGIGRSAGHVYSTLSAMTLRVRVKYERGRLREADETLRRALRYVEKQGVELLPATGAIHIMRGTLLYERDDLDGAERALETGVGMAELTGNVTDLVWGYVTLSRAKRAQGDGRGALAMSREADRVARDYGADLEIAIASAWMMRLSLIRGDLAEAGAWERAYTKDAGPAVPVRTPNLIASARLLHARGRRREALGLLEELREAAEANGRTRELIEILTLQALIRWASSERERAVDNLAEALALAAPEGYVRTFVDEGQPVTALLSEVLQTRRTEGPSIPAHYPERLLAALERDARNVRLSAARLSEPLTERELEVLHLIASGRSNRQISQELFVSVGTAKTHVNHLYRKLGAHSRTQAVARARELGLI